MTEPIQRLEYDVVVIGAGGAGIRAAIESSAQGARTALICKSLFGKAHTVMAEGGIAAALRNVWQEDSWQVHFRDTMRGGKLMNNWRMAQLHAQESPERVLELEEWGALFDRTKDGLILQRDFGGHRYARLAHVGDRTGLEMIRTLQNQAVHKGIDVHMECTIQRLLVSDGAISGCVGYWRQTGALVAFAAKAVILATGGVGKAWTITSNSWEYTGDGIAMALDAGADLIDMEMTQFHPTGMVWPPSVRGILVTEGVRGDGGTLVNSVGRRFMFDYIPEFFRQDTADTEAEADAWYQDKTKRRTPDLLPRDEVARAINAEVKAGRGTPHGGVFLDIASRRSADYIRQRLPSMYHQFKELADVDITTTPMEVGPTLHYIMGGVRVEPDTASTTVPGLFAAGEVAAGLHGANRLGGNSLSDLLVFGRRAGQGAAAYAGTKRAGSLDPAALDGAVEEILAPFGRAESGEDPYQLHERLQRTMQSNVGIVRTASELEQALADIERLKARSATVRVRGGRVYNPGWHLALDLRSMLACAEAVTRSALRRTESRGGHTRADFPKTDKEWGRKNLVVRRVDGGLAIADEPIPQPPPELQALLGDDLPTAAPTTPAPAREAVAP